MAQAKKVCIIYGFAEGPKHGKLLRAKLHAEQFAITESASEAEVIIAHSAGVFLLPKQHNAQLVVLAGSPYKPGRHPVFDIRHKVKKETKDSKWLVKTCYNLFYFVIEPKKWVKMNKAIKDQKWPVTASGQTIVFAHNTDDMFIHPEKARGFIAERGWVYCQLKGQHDEIWLNPSPYVKLISDFFNN